MSLIDKPITRQEMYLSYLNSNTSITLPEPITRIERYLYTLCLNGSGAGGGGGTISGNIINIAVTSIIGGHRVTFTYVLEDGKRESEHVDIMDGEKGERGEQGIQGERGEQGAQGIQGVKGDKGNDGITYTPEIGEVTVGKSIDDAQASVLVDEETQKAIFNFTVPRTGIKALDKGEAEYIYFYHQTIDQETHSSWVQTFSRNDNVLKYLDGRISNVADDRVINEDGQVYVSLKKGLTYRIFGGGSCNACDFIICDKSDNIYGSVGFSDTKYIGQSSENGLASVVATAIITPIKDIEIYLKCKFLDNNSWWLWINTFFFLVQQINITIDPLAHVNETQGIEDSPVGAVISYMGNNAPKHYLECNGQVLQMSQYPYLVQHFIDEFGEAEHFGGDGRTTFAVPSMNNTLENTIYCIKCEPTYFMVINK